jgi:hypothetical protein
MKANDHITERIVLVSVRHAFKGFIVFLQLSEA